MSLQKELDKFLKSPAGQKRVAEARTAALKAGKKFGVGDSAVSTQKAIRYAEELRDIVWSALPPVLKTGENGLEINDIRIGKPTVLANGDIEVGLTFDKDAVHRDSLYPEGNPEGVDNIVRLFSVGYSTDRRVFGYWEGKKIPSAMRLGGSAFMQRAVDEFNYRHAGNGTKATLDPSYNP